MWRTWEDKGTRPTCFVVYNQQSMAIQRQTIAPLDEMFTAELHRVCCQCRQIIHYVEHVGCITYIYIYTRVLSIVSIKVWTLYKMSWNHVSIRLDVSNMHLFWCKLSWMGPWGFHRIASSEDIPRQGPHPSGTLENNRLCPLTDCWQHASHFLKHLESCLPKTIKLRQREAYMGF